MQNGFYGFKCFYKGKSVEVYAQSAYQAQLKASVEFKTKKYWDVAVVCCEAPDGQTITHSTSEV